MAKQGAVRILAQRNVRIALACGIALVIIAACVALLLSKRHDDVPSANSSGASEALVKTDTVKTGTQQPNTGEKTASVPAVDPATLSSIAVEPLGVTVFYSKEMPGFEYEIKRTADGTQYVEFTAQELIGTKCTDDEGLFASIVQNPTSTEDQTTVSQTVSVGGKMYGLSLAGPGCTADASLLEQYQTGFKNGFSSLQAL